MGPWGSTLQNNLLSKPTQIFILCLIIYFPLIFFLPILFLPILSFFFLKHFFLLACKKYFWKTIRIAVIYTCDQLKCFLHIKFLSKGNILHMRYFSSGYYFNALASRKHIGNLYFLFDEHFLFWADVGYLKYSIILVETFPFSGEWTYLRKNVYVLS